jgi:Uma2 family endonuclease
MRFVSGAGWDEMTVVPRIAVRFPLPLPVPDRFDPAQAERWPAVAGRLEFVGGRLLFMPPCGDLQQQTAIDVAAAIAEWQRTHGDFVIGGNEAGMLLGGEVRAADVAVWRRADLGAPTGAMPRVAPLLAVEIAGRDEEPSDLLDKARWYLDRGVLVVWILVPADRAVIVVTHEGQVHLSFGERVPPHAELPDLRPEVALLFRQLGPR